MGVNGLDPFDYSYQLNGDVAAVYAKMGELAWLKWDANGRGFRFDQPGNEECCISGSNVMYLDYRRDADFDLTFE